MGRGKNWSEAEDDFLIKNVGTMRFQLMAKKLNRTVHAIECRVTRLGLDNTKLESGKITGAALANVLNVDPKTVYRWIRKYGLKSTFKVTRTAARFHLVDVYDFWKWAENNKDKLNFNKIDPLSLLPEPEWVEFERKLDYYEIPKNHHRIWSEKDDEILIRCVKEKKTMLEISEMMCRSENGVQRRISKLRGRGALPKLKIVIRWKEEEIKTLLEMTAQGIPDNDIAFHLGRDRCHIVDKRRNMKKSKDNGQGEGWRKGG